MTLFDLTPKDTPAELYGRSRELSELVRLIEAGRWVVILGPRMVGKTSLLKVANQRLRRPTVYVNLWGAKGTLGLVNAFVNGLNNSGSLLARIRKTVARIDGISIGPNGLSVNAPSRPVRTVWDLMDLIGRTASHSVIELDEVQELAAASGSLLRVLGNLFNTHPGVTFAFTGSRVGLVRTLLDAPGGSPLFGRAPVPLQLEPFDRDTSVEFLKRGLKESHLAYPTESLGGIVDRSLDGTPGWLTLFGNNLTIRQLSLPEAEKATIAEGHRVVRDELTHFLEGRDVPTYWGALRILASGATWSEVRNGMSARRATPVNENTVGNLLRNLTNARILDHREGRYVVPDPMVKGFILGNSRPPVPRGLRGPRSGPRRAKRF